jgi:hypothetical protein
MFTSNHRNTAMFFVLALLSAALTSSVALAANRVEVGSRVTIEQDYAFHGKILSRRAVCEGNRTVAVYMVKSGADGLYDTTRSNAEGAWEIPAGAPDGDFYAVARARSIDKGTTTIFCKRAISSALPF